MGLRVKSQLKKILDERGISIRQFAEITELPFETLRRLYNDETKQYQRNTIGRVCEVLGIDLPELLVLVEDNEDDA
ncbi:XRE family transcriptional regulator [Bacillus methanolicus]|uniref:helix-turn-helix domain-containing protein n=1 Tax=Bacillus methanolicus TaxID=1471 RepID=UPI0023809E55|nr:helix-turn-helix transcriptional regulator [Bacillus methanolicus]MDE3838634.1 XRE family transcriptional regulator [Bacillus methanolicus]